jgi:hypothetical protein
MKSVSFNALILGLATALTLTACDRGEKRDSVSARQQDKAQCQAANAEAGAFTALPQKLSKVRADALKAEFGNLNEKLVRTYVVKFKIAAPTKKEDGTVIAAKTIASPDVKIASAQKVDDLKGSGDEIVVELDCANLSAKLTAPGLKIEGLEYKALAKNADAGLDARKQIQLVKNDAELGQIRILVGEYFDESGNADAVKAETSRKFKTIKLSLQTKNEQYEIVQRAGLAKEDSISIDSSVVEIIAQRLGDQAPQSVKDHLSNMKKPQTDEQGKPKPQSVVQSSLTMSENEVIKIGEEINQTPSDIEAHNTQGKLDAAADAAADAVTADAAAGAGAEAADATTAGI